MVHGADVIVAFREYPHTDILERASELYALITRCARGEARPGPGVLLLDFAALPYRRRNLAYWPRLDERPRRARPSA